MSDTKPLERHVAGLPAGWRVMPIGELGSVIGGSTPSRGVSRYWNGDIPWVTPGELTGLATKYLRETRDHITKAGLESCGARLLPEEALLVTSRATIGSVALVRQPTATNQGFKSIVFGRDAEPSFYYHLFQRILPELERRASGTTFLEISGSEFCAVRLPAPELAEQCRIAEILDTLDDAIRKTEQLVGKLKQMRQGLLHDLLTRGIDENGELRDPEQHPGEFKDTLAGKLPRDWTVHALDDLVDPARPVAYGILMPGTGHPGGVPVIKVKDIGGGQIRQDGLLLTSPAIDYEYRRSRVKTGDLLFTIRGTVGRMATVPPPLENANITQDSARIAIKGANVSFVRRYLEMPIPQRFIKVHVLGVAVQGINLRDVRRIPIALPPLKEADEIAMRLDGVDARVSAELDEAAKLRLLRRGLMEDLLSGRVRVTGLLNETAS